MQGCNLDPQSSNANQLPALSLPLQGVDWRRLETYAQGLCNGAANPLPAGANNGVDVDPLEVLFIKVLFRIVEWHVVCTFEALYCHVTWQAGRHAGRSAAEGASL